MSGECCTAQTLEYNELNCDTTSSRNRLVSIISIGAFCQRKPEQKLNLLYSPTFTLTNWPVLHMHLLFQNKRSL